MRIGSASMIALVFTGSALYAQHVGVINPSRPSPAAAGAYRYGNILFPGGVPQNPTNQSHAARLGNSISGYPGYNGVGPQIGSQSPGGRNRTVVVPYAFPVFYGSGYDPYYGAQQQPQNVTVVVPQQAPPNVIINQSFGADWQSTQLSGSDTREKSSVRVWEGAGATEKAPEVKASRGAVADEKPNIYLIALKDSTVRTAIGYWREGGTLHYLTPESTVNRVSLDMVDRELSERLNRERKLEFELPVAR